jgi:anti-anti-sigma factor
MFCPISTLPVVIVGERRPQVRIQTTKDAAFAVLELEGRLAAGHGAGCLSDTVDILLTQGLQHIFLDMHLVDLVDCAGIGQLVRCYCRARGRGGSLTLIRAHPRLHHLLRLFRLQDHLKAFDSGQAAVGGLTTVNLRKGLDDLSSAGPHASFQQPRNALSSVSSQWVAVPEICDIAETVRTLAPACQRPEKSGTISHYRIIQKIAEGGMGVVYQAVDTQLDRIVALKFLNQSAVDSDGQKEQLLFEAKAAAALNHPSICTVHEICEAEGQMCIVMEYIEGESLQQKIKQSRLNLDDALDLAIAIGHALKAVHRKRIIHRDIKSANVMVLPEGQPKIMDFGLAFLGDRSPSVIATGTNGTPAYMSPEQVRGELATERTDIWGLGVTLYEMISGRLPFIGRNADAMLLSILRDDPEPLTKLLQEELPLELDRILRKALAKEPAERYQHMQELILDFEALRKNSAYNFGESRNTTCEARAATSGSRLGDSW